MESVLQRFKQIQQANPRLFKLLSGCLVLYLLNRLYQRWRYAQKLFLSRQERANKAVLVTGCDSGFGHSIAINLAVKHGFRVIATCLKQESVDQFLSNSSFTSNASTATVMNVTKSEDIQRVKQFTLQYLQDTNCTLWAIVNNAGFAIPGPFEVVPAELDFLERDVLFLSPLNIIRAFLPLLPGRQSHHNSHAKTANDGGRIVNLTSSSARFVFPECRYGPSKASLSYFTHVLRMELSPRFGIWCACVEPAAYNTNIWTQGIVWGRKVEQTLQKRKQAELMDIYEFNVDKMEKGLDKYIKNEDMHSTLNIRSNLDEVVDCVIHGVSAKNPMRCYCPGWDLTLKFLAHAPLWMSEPLQLFLQRKQREMMRKM